MNTATPINPMLFVLGVLQRNATGKEKRYELCILQWTQRLKQYMYL